MRIKHLPLSWYVERLVTGPRFSMGMYGDAEWIALFGKSVGGRNAEFTVYTPELCRDLRESLRFDAPDFYYSIPAVLGTLRGFERIKEIADHEYVEKDMWDKEVRTGGLCPLIAQLQKMRTCIISNANLRRLDFLGYESFVEISYPNCHPEVERAANEALNFDGNVFLISAGMPAALIAQRIHAARPDAFALDLGSVWDAFVGIGRQRGWRAEIYASQAAYDSWMDQYASVGVKRRAVPS